MITQSTETFPEIGTLSNPFPGLRPFEFDESHLFFGRDGQSEQLIGKLGRTRFLAVVGSSGSGKSSLVRAGLLPALLGGFMTSAGSGWRIAILRPGNDPVGNLARALNSTEVFGSEIGENAAIQNAITEANLRRGSRGLVEAVRQNAMPGNENLLVLVDQFEELFRFARETSRKTKDESERYQNDAAAFVKLLLEAHTQREANIYVVLTMRSDFLGDCAQFWGLPETINESQYLTPRLTRDQLREAITGPVAVGGGEITQRLLNRLLNDVGDNQDQLPVLQHLLMRVWDERKEKRLEVVVKGGEGAGRRPHKEVHEGEAIDLCCYEAVGGMAEALSRHADEAFNELPDDRHCEVTEKLFKALTEKGPDNREIRRPIMLGEICAVTRAAEAEVVTVVDTFRMPGRSFLMPPAGVALNSESLIDISHESLIRGWERLRNWVDEEAQSARIYRRLAETAELNREGKAGLWGDPDLQLALDWQAKNEPNEDWARRYYPGFGTAIAFLQASEQKRADDIAERERQQREEAERSKRELAQAQALAEAEQQRAEAERQKVEEQQQRLEDQARATSRLRRLMAALVVVALVAMIAAAFALAAQRTAKAESKRANEQARIAELGQEELKQALLELNTAKDIADSAKSRAEESLHKAEEQTLIAEIRKREAEHAKLLEEEQRIIAEKNLQDAKQQRLIADQLGPTLAKRLAIQSDIVRLASDTSLDLSALLAVESSKLSSPVGDQALRAALSVLPRRLALKKIEDRTQISAFSQDGRYLATASTQQTVRVWEAATGQLRARTMPHGSEVIDVTLSPDGEYLATLGNDYSVRVWRAGTGQPVGRTIKPENYVKTIALSPDGSHLATAGGDTAQMWEVSTGETFGKAMKHGDEVSAMSFSLDGNYLATGCGHAPHRGNPSRLSAAYIWKAATGEQVGEPIGQSPSGVVKSVAISPDGRYLAMAGAEVQVWDMSSRQKLGDLGAAGSSVVFSPDGKYLAAKDGERVWVRSLDFDNKESLVTPVALMFHEVPVSALAFDANGNRLLAVSADGAIGTWERTSHVAAAKIPEGGGFTRDVVFSSDSRHLVMGGARGLKEWEVATGEPTGPAMRDSEVHRALINREIAAFSRDGRYLATMKEGDDTKVWDTNTRKVIARLKQEPWIKAVTFSADGEYLATINEDRTIRLFKFYNGRELLRMSAGAVKAIAVSPQRQYLATVGEDYTVRVMELKLDDDELVGEAEREVTGSTEIARISHATEVRAVIFSRNGRNFATASGNTVRIWESATGRLVGRPLEHQGGVLGIAFSSDGHHLATAGQDKTVRVWDVMTSQPVGPTLQHEGSVNAVAFDSFGSKYLATSSENTARVWEWATGQLLGPPIRTEGKVVALVLHGKDTLTTADESHKVQRWKVTAGKPEGELPLAYGEAVPAVALSPYGGYLVTGSRSVRKVYLPTGVQVSGFFGDSGEINALAISADGKRVATADESGAVQVWSVANQQVVARMLHKSVHVIGFSPDGKYLATGGDQDHLARVWNATTGEPIGKPLEHKSGLRAVAFSPDGKYVATGDADTVARVWEAVTGLPIKSMSHGDFFNAIGFSRDGKYLVTGGNKDTQIWDLATGERVATISNPGAKLAFSPDGRFLATLGAGETQIWLWPPKELANDACARLIRNFTADEWQQYVGDEPYRKTCEGLPIHPSFVNAAISMATKKDLQGATKIFEQLAKLEPGLKIDPKAEARWHQDINEVNELLNQTSGLEAQAQLAKLEEAVALYKRQVADARSHTLYAALGVAPWSWTFNKLCWDGSLNGRAADVIDACEWLVSSAPRRWDYRDSRGLARALTGDIKGAIEDFQESVNGTGDEEVRLQRKRWIEALRAGKNPFTPEELKNLRDH